MKKQSLYVLGILLISVILVSGCIGVAEDKEESTWLDIKDKYELGEEIEIKVVNDLKESIYIYSYDYPYYKIYKLENENWNELFTYVSYGCDCTNEILQCPLLIPELPKCTEIKDEKIFQWDQKIDTHTTEECGNDTLWVWKEKTADTGNYKIVILSGILLA
jgi:hypothetical protein